MLNKGKLTFHMFLGVFHYAEFKSENRFQKYQSQWKIIFHVTKKRHAEIDNFSDELLF